MSQKRDNRKKWALAIFGEIIAQKCLDEWNNQVSVSVSLMHPKLNYTHTHTQVNVTIENQRCQGNYKK